MTSGPTTTPGTGFGPVTQLAWVTDDLDATERALGATLGAVGWTRLPGIHFGPDACTLRGEPADFTADISLSYAGELQLELIRPVAGASMYAEFLAERGPGLHHVCCEVASMDEALARAEAEGFAVVQAGAMAGGLMRFAYLDTAAAGASYVELAEVSPALREMFAQIKERSGRDPR